nr:hypothetical protein StreXyl84_67060 [Streptomyces sp. Xyl84]
MSLFVQPLLGVAAAIAIGAPVPLGTAAASPAVTGEGSPAVTAEGTHCDRADQDVWGSGPSRNLSARLCSIPDHQKRWYTVEVDTLMQTYYKGDTPEGGVDRTKALRHRTIRCLGYTRNSDTGTVDWFGCPPV